MPRKKANEETTTENELQSTVLESGEKPDETEVNTEAQDFEIDISQIDEMVTTEKLENVADEDYFDDMLSEDEKRSEDIPESIPMNNSNQNTYTAMCTTFCSYIKQNGYLPGVYSSASMYGYKLNKTTLKNNGISIWNAEWNSKCSIPCDIWQYSEKGKVNGISCNVDMNYIFNLNLIK